MLCGFDVCEWKWGASIAREWWWLMIMIYNIKYMPEETHMKWRVWRMKMAAAPAAHLHSSMYLWKSNANMNADRSTCTPLMYEEKTKTRPTKPPNYDQPYIHNLCSSVRIFSPAELPKWKATTRHFIVNYFLPVCLSSCLHHATYVHHTSLHEFALQNKYFHIVWVVSYTQYHIYYKKHRGIETRPHFIMRFLFSFSKISQKCLVVSYNGLCVKIIISIKLARHVPK